MLKTLLFVGVAALIAVAAASFAVDYDEEDITAYHFHTYFFLGNRRAEEEAMSFRLVKYKIKTTWGAYAHEKTSNFFLNSGAPFALKYKMGSCLNAHSTA